MSPATLLRCLFALHFRTCPAGEGLLFLLYRLDFDIITVNLHI